MSDHEKGGGQWAFLTRIGVPLCEASPRGAVRPAWVELASLQRRSASAALWAPSEHGDLMPRGEKEQDVCISRTRLPIEAILTWHSMHLNVTAVSHVSSGEKKHRGLGSREASQAYEKKRGKGTIGSQRSCAAEDRMPSCDMPGLSGSRNHTSCAHRPTEHSTPHMDDPRWCPPSSM